MRTLVWLKLAEAILLLRVVKTEIILLKRSMLMGTKLFYFCFLKIFLTLKFPFRVRDSAVIALDNQSGNQLEKCIRSKGSVRGERFLFKTKQSFVFDY